MQQLVCLPNPTQYIKCKCNNVVEYSYTLLTQNSSVVSAFCCAWLKVSQTLSHAICCAWLIASEFVGHAFCCACAINCVTQSWEILSHTFSCCSGARGFSLVLSFAVRGRVFRAKISWPARLFGIWKDILAAMPI